MEEKTNYLAHHGVKGMRWGVRRYQNPDGSLIKKSSGSRKRLKKATKEAKKNWDSEGRERITSGALDRTIKQGKDKPKLSPTEDVLKKTNKTINDTSDAYRAIKQASRRSKDYADEVRRREVASKMSDAELNKQIKRMNLEQQYLRLTDSYKPTGRDRVEDILDILGPVSSIALTTAGIAATLYSIKHP